MTSQVAVARVSRNVEDLNEAQRRGNEESMKRRILSLATHIASEAVLQQARWDLRLRLRRFAAQLSSHQRQLLTQLAREARTDLRVNIGCGPLPTPGWLNIDGLATGADLIQMLDRPLDLPDGCAAMVFSEHVLEHVEFPTSSRLLLREVVRILRPGGRFRVIVPDAERVIDAYVRRDHDLLAVLAPGEQSPIEAVNKIFRENGFHRYAYDYALLERELLRAGFATVRRADFRDSSTPALNIDFDEPERIAQSLYVEADKAQEGAWHVPPQ